jgi:hypothetical protein
MKITRKAGMKLAFGKLKVTAGTGNTRNWAILNA